MHHVLSPAEDVLVKKLYSWLKLLSNWHVSLDKRKDKGTHIFKLDDKLFSTEDWNRNAMLFQNIPKLKFSEINNKRVTVTKLIFYYFYYCSTQTFFIITLQCPCTTSIPNAQSNKQLMTEGDPLTQLHGHCLQQSVLAPSQRKDEQLLPFCYPSRSSMFCYKNESVGRHGNNMIQDSGERVGFILYKYHIFRTQVFNLVNVVHAPRTSFAATLTSVPNERTQKQWAIWISSCEIPV